MLRGVLLLRVGFEDIAVGTATTFLIAMIDVAILMSSWLWRRARGNGILPVECCQLLLMLDDELRVSSGIEWRGQCRGEAAIEDLDTGKR